MGGQEVQDPKQHFKGEGHSRNGVFFEIANEKITLS